MFLVKVTFTNFTLFSFVLTTRSFDVGRCDSARPAKVVSARVLPMSSGYLHVDVAV